VARGFGEVARAAPAQPGQHASMCLQVPRRLTRWSAQPQEFSALVRERISTS